MRFLVADDHELFREGFMHFLSKHFSDAEINIAATYEEVEQQLAENEYDLIFLDLRMPGAHGVMGIQDLCKQVEDIPTIIVSAEENPSIIHTFLRLGVAAFIPKSSENTTMEHAIKEVLCGRSYFPCSALIPDHAMEMILNMSEKKQKLLKLLAQGKSNKEIAEDLFLSEGTVRQYVSGILRDLQVDNRTQASIKAREFLRMNGGKQPSGL